MSPIRVLYIFTFLICLVLLSACQRASAPHPQLSTVTVHVTYPSPLFKEAYPKPSATPRCWIYDQMYRATADVFRQQRLNWVDRATVKQWAMTVSPEQRPLVRWMRNPNGNSIVVFIMLQDHELPEGWIALNTNILINIDDCALEAVPNI